MTGSYNRQLLVNRAAAVALFLLIVLMLASCASAPADRHLELRPDGFNESARIEISELGFFYTYPGTMVDERGTAPPVFSGAVGYGTATAAGNNGRVIKVTTLAANGPGSLREALAAQGPRLVVFEVGGIIDLEMRGMSITNPDITIAGQTAPSPGITIIRGGITVSTHDVLIQHIRIRPGDGGDKSYPGWEIDGLGTSGNAHNVVFDHISVSWGTDEGLSVSGPRAQGPEAASHYVTISNSIIAEGLNNATHSKGAHSKGTLIHDNSQYISLIGNIWAHNVDRNPYFKAFTIGYFANNLIYNPGSNGLRTGYVPSEWLSVSAQPLPARVTAVGNALIHGDNTNKQLALVGTEGIVYLEDNLAVKKDGSVARQSMGRMTILQNPPVWLDDFTPLPSTEVEAQVLATAGARPWDRDAVDTRILSDIAARRGKIIDSQEEVGGYPEYEGTRRELDVPDENRIQWLYSFTTP